MNKSMLFVLLLTVGSSLGCKSRFEGTFASREGSSITANSQDDAVATRGKYSETEIVDILDSANKRSPSRVLDDYLAEGSLENITIDDLIDHVAKNTDLSQKELDVLRESILEIEGKKGEATPPLSVVFDKASVRVKSSDLPFR